LFFTIGADRFERFGRRPHPAAFRTFLYGDFANV
jgi:hypothetical protein